MTVAEYLLPAWLTALRAAGSGAAVALSAVNSAEVVEAVLTGAILRFLSLASASALFKARHSRLGVS
jgi:hypothetical protein